LQTSASVKQPRVTAAINPDLQAYKAASDMRYEQLDHELRTIKVQLATMTEVSKQEMLFTKVTKGKPLIEPSSGIRVSQ